MSKIEKILDTLSDYHTDNKDDMYASCIRERLDACVQQYEKNLKEAVTHLSLYRKDIVVLNKYNKEDTDTNDRYS